MNNSTTIPNNIFFSEVESMIKEGQKVRIKVIGTSMQPTFRHSRDEIVLSSFEPMQLLPLSVVLFNRTPSSKCVHRIVRRNGDILFIRGDGNYGSFEIANVEDVTALVVGGTMRDGRPFSINDLKWKRWSAFWVKIYPLRLAYFRTKHFLGTIYRKLFKHITL
ncbi:MAG: hypothetical protein PHD11_05000 [Bacteroidales bacterium]|nr:hypothetical protein [Bacteroidales bacterium]MDD4669528.1 hypothetical protein [Bacteroidales bacterium]